MKPISLPRIVLLGCTLSVACITAASAQDTTNDTTTAPASDNHGGYHHRGEGVLTPDEWAELKKDREQVLASNPDLKSQGEDLRSQMKSLKDATPDDKQALFAKWKAYQDQVDEAIVQIDPDAAPIIAKLKAAFQHRHHHDGGSNSSSDSSTTSTNSGN